MTSVALKCMVTVLDSGSTLRPHECRSQRLPARAGPRTAAETRGLWLGLLGVVIFAMTLPMTRLAVGPADAPQLPPLFVTAGPRGAGRAAQHRLPALDRAPRWPPRRLWPALRLCAAGTVVGFPLFLALALREVDAMHAAVVTGLLPLATAAIAALAFRQRPSPASGPARVAGSALVLAFAAWAGRRPPERRPTACCCWRS